MRLHIITAIAAVALITPAAVIAPPSARPALGNTLRLSSHLLHCHSNEKHEYLHHNERQDRTECRRATV